MNAMSAIIDAPTTWEQCHAAGMTAKQAALAMGKDVRRAYDWANSASVSFAKDPAISAERAVDLPPLPPMTSLNVRFSDCQRLFICVATAALTDLRTRIAGARAGKRSLYLTTGERVGLMTLEAEIREAGRYLRSNDFRLLCEMAGLDHDPERAMAWVIGQFDTPIALTGRRNFPKSAPGRAQEASQ